MTPTEDTSPPAPPDASGEVEALRARVEALSESLAARDAFLAVAAHELRNPMTPILAHVQRLRLRTSRATREEIDASLARIEGLVESYVRRATTLLDVARLTQGHFVLSPRPMDVAAVVREVVEAHEAAARHVGSNLSLASPDTCLADLDPLAIEQILDNLVSNAVKYGAGSAVAVALTVATEGLVLTVRDGGAGISEADQARIFDRFERAVGRGSGIGGFGVGLWVVSRLVHAMGGRIAIDSRTGAGTTFTVVLPRRLSEERAASHP